MSDCVVKEHKRKRSRVRRHTRHLTSKGERAKAAMNSRNGSGYELLKRSFKAFHPDHSLRKIKIHHNKSGKITATYKYGSGNVAHFTFTNGGWQFNYER